MRWMKRFISKLKMTFFFFIQKHKIPEVRPGKICFCQYARGTSPVKAAPIANGQNHGIEGTEPRWNIPCKRNTIIQHKVQHRVKRDQPETNVDMYIKGPKVFLAF